MKMSKKIAVAALMVAVLANAMGQMEEAEVKTAAVEQTDAKPMSVPVILPPA